MAQHYGNYSVLDYSNEKSPVKVYHGAVTQVNITDYLQEFGQMRDAIAGMSLGTMHSEQWVGDYTVLSNTRPTDPDAQRERKALVIYKGNTSQKLYSLSIPAARTKDGSNAALITPGTDKYILTMAPVSTFVTRFQSFARTPDNDQENVTVQEIRLVGRNI